MSKFLKPPYYKDRALVDQWINTVYQTHSLICGCNSPIKHLNERIKEQQCHHFAEETTTTETTGTQDGGETDLDAGELERLFKESDDAEG